MTRRGTFLLLSALLAGGDWPDFGRDAGRARASTEVVGAALAPVWSPSLGSGMISSAAVTDGVVVVALRDGTVRGLRESDGAPLWSFDAGGEVHATPAISAGRAYVAERDGRLSCLRLADGAPLWTLHLGGSVQSSPLIVGGTLYVGTAFPKETVRAVNIANGVPIWETPVNGPVLSSPAFDGANVRIGTTRGRYYALNPATGGIVSFIDTPGSVRFSSPAVAGGQTFVLPGGADAGFRILGGGSVTLTDPGAPAPATIVDRRVDTSSPAAAGALVTAVVRFTYWVDADLDAFTDTYTMNEYAVAMNPVGPALAWQTPLAVVSSSNGNAIPLLGLVPSPAATDAGALLAVGSSLDPTLRMLDAATGGVLASYAVDAPGRSSPVVSNARVLWGTDRGTLWAFESAANPPPSPPVSGFDPPDGSFYSTAVSVLSWDAAVDPNDAPSGLRYIVRIDTDGEILEDWSEEIVTAFGATTATLGAPAGPSAVYTYAIRTEDAGGARSGWSAPRSFTVSTAPMPPTGLTAAPSISAAVLNWTASPTPGVVGYRVRWSGGGGPVFTAGASLLVAGLGNGVTYTFDVRAVDADGDESVPALATATPTDVGIVSVEGIPFASLASAMAFASPGDTILVGRGVFAVPPGMTLEGMSLIGISPHDTWLDASGLGTGITLVDDAAATPIRLEHFSIFGAAVGIDATSGAARLTHLVIRDMSDAGVRVRGSAIVDLVNSTLDRIASAAVDVVGGAAVVRNNILLRSGTGLRCRAPGTVENSFNDVWGHAVADYDGCAPGPGDFSMAVAFLDEPGRDYRVRPNEPSIDAGDPFDDFSLEPLPNGGRVNVGAYGNTVWAARMEALGADRGRGGRDGCSIMGVRPGAGGPALLWVALSALFLFTLRRRA